MVKSVHVGDSVYDLLEKHCHKTNQKFAHVVEKAIVEKLSAGSSDPEIKMAGITAKYDLVKRSTRIVKDMMKFINFFDGYSNQNEETMIKNLSDVDAEYKEIIGGVFKVGRDSAKVVKDDLKELLGVLKEIKGEDSEPSEPEEPKPLGHPPRFTPKPKCRHENTKETGDIAQGRKVLECQDCGLKMLGDEEPVEDKTKTLGHAPRLKREPTLEELARRKYGET
jgi:hypothetical protein